jgi:hypothetical protein
LPITVLEIQASVPLFLLLLLLLLLPCPAGRGGAQSWLRGQPLALLPAVWAAGATQQL